MSNELPPLPEFAHAFRPRWPGDPGGFCEAQMHAYAAQYAAQAVAAERERCAKLCEQTDEDGEGPDCWGWHAKDYARAIRSQK